MRARTLRSRLDRLARAQPGRALRIWDASPLSHVETAHVQARPVETGGRVAPPGIDEWVAAFKAKRAEIVNNSCESADRQLASSVQ